MDDDIFPYYCLQFRGKSFLEIRSTFGEDALSKIKTVLSDGIAKNFRQYCVNYADRQRSRVIVRNKST